MTGPVENKAGGLGHFDGKAHVLPLRVYYEDTDLSGMVYHANYLRYMEQGRTEFYSSLWQGITEMADLESAEPTAWAIRNVEVSLSPVPARVTTATSNVRTVLTAISGARLHAHQRIYANEGDTLLTVRTTIEACIVTLTGKPRRIDPARRFCDLLTPFLYETERLDKRTP